MPVDTPRPAADLRSTIDLAHNLGLEAVAEGVTTETIRERLRELGCDLGQGFHFARPMPGGEIEDWLRTSPWSIDGSGPVDAAGPSILHAVGRDEPGLPGGGANG